MATRIPNFSGQGIDFMAIARGRELANDLNWQDELRAEQRDRNAFARDERNDATRMRALNRESQAYVAPLINNMQRASSAGIAPTDFLIQQREQITQDPNFQNFAPEVQQQVWKSLGNSVRAQLQDLQRQGNLADATRLARSYGMMDVSTPLDAATLQGNPQGIVDAVNQMYGAELTLNPDNTITILGQDVPADQVLYNIARTRSVTGALPAVAAQRQQGAAQQRLAQDLRQNYAMAGMVQGEDGLWRMPTTQAVTPTGVAGVPTGSASPVPAIPGPAQVPATRAGQLVSSALGGGQRPAQPSVVQQPSAMAQAAQLQREQIGATAPTPAGLLGATDPNVLGASLSAQLAQSQAETGLQQAVAIAGDRSAVLDFTRTNPGAARLAAEQLQAQAQALQDQLDATPISDPSGAAVAQQLQTVQRALANYTLAISQQDQLANRRIR